ncbi:4'-phosphopantetheinyl transferase family protein [Flavobacterium sp. T12S277]|uniref:4'-phosphopantetheinyl transferase family protein n=1 Tax=Flavobacterium sp. T12S277 TaxID=3402752 RepID=UPI003AE593DC
MIHIYYSYLSEENHQSLLQNDLPQFPLDYQEKIKRYRRWQDAQLSLLGRILLFKGIEETYKKKPGAKQLLQTFYNKPYFEDNRVLFNISHSGEIVVCALSDQHEVGIDVEIITDIETADFKPQMTDIEWTKIARSQNKKEAFFEYWTQKEAVLKAQGHGLIVPLKSFEVLDNTTEINGEKYYLSEVKIDEKYKCHISLKTDAGEIYLKRVII